MRLTFVSSAAASADCSGDSILAPLTGAPFRIGREAKADFGEEFALPEADRRTMGSSLLIQARETDHPVSFTPPSWAYSFPASARAVAMSAPTP